MNRRDDDLEMLDADMSRIMGQLDIPDLPVEVRATLKLELDVLFQMWVDLHGERQKSSSHHRLHQSRHSPGGSCPNAWCS